MTNLFTKLIFFSWFWATSFGLAKLKIPSLSFPWLIVLILLLIFLKVFSRSPGLRYHFSFPLSILFFSSDLLLSGNYVTYLTVVAGLFYPRHLTHLAVVELVRFFQASEISFGAFAIMILIFISFSSRLTI